MTRSGNGSIASSSSTLCSHDLLSASSTTALYAYVGNSPLNATDPTGEIGIVGGIIGAIGGAAVETFIQLAENGGDIGNLDGGRINDLAVDRIQGEIADMAREVVDALEQE